VLPNYKHKHTSINVKNVIYVLENFILKLGLTGC